ncbi:MAG: NAD(P)/FAD-dependent oxidoreductase [Clostridia bacterium]|nr:NAD(P)/FAD-dependent oxidoreductase [Clostridia bacterium]
MNKNYDVVIVGCGTSGAAIAFTLAQYDLKVAVLERENDVAMGTTRANSGILHAGYDPEPGTLMAKLNVRGVAIAKELSKKLRFAYNPVGSLVLAFSGHDLKTLKTLKARADANGVKDCRILSKEEVQQMEPMVSEDVIAALYAPSAVCSPWEFCLTMAETAALNGTEILLETEVVGISRENGKDGNAGDAGNWKVVAKQTSWPNGPANAPKVEEITLTTRFVVNAAGLAAEKIHDMAAPHSFSIKPSRGEYYLMDKAEGFRARHTIFQCPDENGKGVLVSPTVHGNLIVGPNSEEIKNNDYSTTAGGMAFVRKSAVRSVPSIDFRNNIRNFAGIRARSTSKDFIIEEAKGAPNFIDVAGICSPGLSAAPAIGEYVTELMAGKGLKLIKKPGELKLYKEPHHFKDLDAEQKNALIARDPSYGRIVCRCESITEGEMRDTFNSPLPPRSVDGIKRRTMAGLGRCQGGFCGPQVVKLLAEYMGVTEDRIVQDKAGSWMVLRREDA